ncbi:MAG: GDP-mannose 4,6-dehydratase [Candidatus Riflebacteria bacterium]|nr:GDP-mannose 4,6-dehydratase [Candidatus Riflebacteria bacterium]
MTAIIFGASGQDGFYLSEICKKRGIEPISVSRSVSPVRASVAEYGAVERLVKLYQPGYIFHLAANSTTRHDALFENHETISTGTLNILESVKRHSPQTRVFITGSGLQFKNRGEPISERDEFEANSAYSASRIHSVYAARYYRSIGIKAYVGYLFHHESPLRKPDHISQIIVQAAKRIAAGSNETIEVGDISVQKEWTFAGDISMGIFTLIDQDSVFEATIGSGVVYSIQDWLEKCFEIVGRNWRDHIRIRDGFKAEYRKLVSDSATIKSLGWVPELSIDQLARAMISF